MEEEEHGGVHKQSRPEKTVPGVLAIAVSSWGVPTWEVPTWEVRCPSAAVVIEAAALVGPWVRCALLWVGSSVLQYAEAEHWWFLR